MTYRGFAWCSCLVLSVVGRVGPCLLAAEQDKKGLVEVRQGGYVEKVDPTINYQERMPRILPCEPDESMKAFHVIPGFRLEQVATEPMIADAVDMAFDENGRMYVAQLASYGEKEQKGVEVTGFCRVSLLEDTDGNGRFDKATVFSDDLTWPTGLACFDGGLFVATSPDVIYLKDTDGDGKADLREVFITGFDKLKRNFHCPNSLRWGLDSRIQGMAGRSGGELRAVKWQRGGEGRKADPVQARGRDFSFDPRTGQLRLESGGSQFGMTFDPWGRKFESSNSVPIEMVMYEDRYVARNPYLIAPSPLLRIYADGRAVFRTSRVEPWRALRTDLRIKGLFSGSTEGGSPAGYFTGACGVYVYQGDAFPEAFRGNAFVAEGSGNLVHRMRLEPDGVALTAHRTDKQREFLNSDEVWFRPIQFTDAPDGTLYVADMYRETYEHPDAIPPSARKYLDLLSGSDRGRIYRVVPEGFRQPPPVHLGEMPTVKLVGLLEHANGWHRITASRLLYERQDRKAIEPLKKLAAESSSALGRMHALYGLDGQDALSPEVVLARLDDKRPRVREHAVRLAERVLENSPAVRNKLYAMAGDGDPRVRYQLAFTLGEIRGSQSSGALAAIASRDVGDRWIQLAVLSSCFGRAGGLFARLMEDARWRATNSGRALLEQLAEQTGLQNHADQVAEVLQVLESLTDKDKQLAQAAVRGLSKGLAKSGSPLLARLDARGGSRAGQLLMELTERAKQDAADPDKPLERRVAAVRSLGLVPLDEVGDILAGLLDSRQPQGVQTAAIQALNRFRDGEVAEFIVEAWQGFTPKVRGEAAEALFARPERLSILLDAIEDQTILPGQLDPSRIQFLLSHPDKPIRERANRLLQRVALAPREKVVDAWRSVLDLQPDPANGKEVFRRECSKCHKLEGVGVELGLPLDTIGNRGPETILLAVLDPNREVNPAYVNYIVITDAGLSVTGMISSETATSITLKRAEGETDTVLRADIDELVNTGLSIMPEGQEKTLTEQEMADVIGYLMSLE